MTRQSLQGASPSHCPSPGCPRRGRAGRECSWFLSRSHSTASARQERRARGAAGSTGRCPGPLVPAQGGVPKAAQLQGQINRGRATEPGATQPEQEQPAGRVKVQRATHRTAAFTRERRDRLPTSAPHRPPACTLYASHSTLPCAPPRCHTQVPALCTMTHHAHATHCVHQPPCTPSLHPATLHTPAAGRAGDRHLALSARPLTPALAAGPGSTFRTPAARAPWPGL